MASIAMFIITVHIEKREKAVAPGDIKQAHFDHMVTCCEFKCCGDEIYIYIYVYLTYMSELFGLPVNYAVKPEQLCQGIPAGCCPTTWKNIGAQL